MSWHNLEYSVHKHEKVGQNTSKHLFHSIVALISFQFSISFLTCHCNARWKK